MILFNLLRLHGVCLYKVIHTTTNRSAAQPHVVKEDSADRHTVVQLTSPKSGTLEVRIRVEINLDHI
jgi:hypothetical protein